MLANYVNKKKVRSLKTAKTYQGALRVWARTRGFQDPDLAVQEIKDKQLDPYQVLQDFVVQLQEDGRAPKTITTYVGALKGFLVDSDIEISNEKAKQKVVLPHAYEISSDRAPTKEEMKSLLLRSKLPTKTAIAMLASSGMRVGELTQLKVSNVELGKEGAPSKITLKPALTKTRKRRLTFISAEATALLKEYLGENISNPNTVLFPEGTDALYGRIKRAIERTGLRQKSDSESARYQLHPHCFRKYFFSNALAAGLDRGLVEGFMGHTFALDSAYLRMPDEELAKEYMKAADRLTFLTVTTGITDQHLTKTLQERDARITELEARIRALEGLKLIEQLNPVRVVMEDIHDHADDDSEKGKQARAVLDAIDRYITKKPKP